MKMHPAEVAKELKDFTFFKSFSEDLLLQLSAMTITQSFKPGDVILRERDSGNKLLYFLRSGKILVTLGGETVTILQTPGEVMGEMSVVSSGVVSTTLTAHTDVECFVIDTNSFDGVHPRDRDHFQSLLYRIYSVILTERLKKTNEKARLFEISNRELHEAQNMSGGLSGRVLLLESEKKLQVIAKLALGGTGVDLSIVSEATEAETFLKNQPVDLLICEDKNLDFLETAYNNKWAKNFLLMTTSRISNSLETLGRLPFVDNVVSRNIDDRIASSKALLTSINKVINKDLFGLEKYLSWGVEINNQLILHSRQRDELKNNMTEHFRRFGVRNSILDRVNTVVEEMLMNAIYDAPVDSYGRSLFNHMSRKEEILLDTHQRSQLRYACDGINLAVAVEDSFGALTKDIVINYLKSCYSGQAGTLNAGKGGAGRGLHQIVENADLTIFNVKSGIRTEVICIFNLEVARVETIPGLQYFFI